ncbi:MAG: SRPBCC family protein [Vicinamibacterales bacterium]
MPESASAITVRKQLIVEASCARAFEVFTSEFDSWWPPSHHIGKADLFAAIIEPRAGGRWYEKGVDGSECDWGRVLAWEPPTRLVLSWHLNGQWEVDNDPAHGSEIEVRFTPDGDARTIIHFEHRHIERSAYAEQLRAGVDSPGGWTGLLASFAEKARG